ncbi:hypothetical protein ACFL2O_11355 [Thermodesulfobacteriota bacterium]
MEEVKIFKLLDTKQGSEKDRLGISIGIHLKISGIDVDIPVSPVYYSKEEFERELKKIHENLDEIFSDAEKRFGIISVKGHLNIAPDMAASDIWSALDNIEDEGQFVEQFNVLEKEIREAVAEHVLARCNIFSGKGSVFSSRYNESTKYIE